MCHTGPGHLQQGLRTRFLGDLCQYTQQIVVLPPGEESSGGDTLALAALLRLEQAQRQLPQPAEVLGAVARPVPLVIFPEAYVEDPVQCVLDPPMAPRPSQVVLRRPFGAADEVADLVAG